MVQQLLWCTEFPIKTHGRDNTGCKENRINEDLGATWLPREKKMAGKITNSLAQHPPMITHEFVELEGSPKVDGFWWVHMILTGRK